MNGLRDHAPDRVLPGEDLASRARGLIQLLERNRLLVRGDLEDGVGRRVDDPLARPLVLLAQLLDDLGAGRSLVAEHAAAGLVHERVDHVVRKAVRIGGHRLRGHHPHQLPVAGRRVLPLRALDQPASDRRGTGLRRTALERLDVAEPERLEVREVEAPNDASDVSERVRALVAILGGVGKRARSHGIEHDYASPRHMAILGRPCGTSSDCWECSSSAPS